MHCIVQSDILHNTQVPEGFVNLNVALLNFQGKYFSFPIAIERHSNINIIDPNLI